MSEVHELAELSPASWVTEDGWHFGVLPGADFVLCTPEPERGVWVMGRSPDDCRREWFRLRETWPGYTPSRGLRKPEEELER